MVNKSMSINKHLTTRLNTTKQIHISINDDNKTVYLVKC